MSIVFYCQSCGSRFNVGGQMVGKEGRCKKCGKRMVVPNVAEVASGAYKPQPVAVAVAVGAGAGTAPVSSWLGAVEASKVSLAPLTIDRMPAAYKKPSMFAEDDLADAKPYVLAQPERRSGGRPVSQVNGVKILWRQQLGIIERLFRWINQTAYLVSVPFLMILLIGTMIRNHPMAIFGATMVVVLNVARLGFGLANLVVIPFRDGLNLRRLKKPMKRLVEPAITIGLVGLAFAFVPWLSRGGTSRGVLPGHFRAGLKNFEHRLEDEQAKAKALDVAPAHKKR